MNDSYFKIVLQTLAEKIDRLRGEIFVRDMEIEKLKEANKKLEAENIDLREQVQFFMDELKAEEVEDG